MKENVLREWSLVLKEEELAVLAQTEFCSCYKNV
jgi:hypothetical protein